VRAAYGHTVAPGGHAAWRQIEFTMMMKIEGGQRCDVLLVTEAEYWIIILGRGD